MITGLLIAITILWTIGGLVSWIPISISTNDLKVYNRRQKMYIYFLAGPAIWVIATIWFAIIKPIVRYHKQILHQLGRDDRA